MAILIIGIFVHFLLSRKKYLIYTKCKNIIMRARKNPFINKREFVLIITFKKLISLYDVHLLFARISCRIYY